MLFQNRLAGQAEGYKVPLEKLFQHICLTNSIKVMQLVGKVSLRGTGSAIWHELSFRAKRGISRSRWSLAMTM